MKLVKKWVICKDQNNKPFPVEVTGEETKLLFLVYAKNNQEQWKHLPSCLGYRTRLSKTDRRLFETKEAAVLAYIEALQASRESHLARAEEILGEVRELRSHIV